MRKKKYVPFGKEWELEMMAFTKKELVSQIRRYLLTILRLEKQLEDKL